MSSIHLPRTLEDSVTALQCVNRWPSHGAMDWTRGFLRMAASCTEIAAIVAVGSAVRGADFAADIDLVYLFDDPRPVFEPPPIDVDVRGYPRGDASRMIASGHELLGWAIVFGRLIFERDGCWTQLLEQWQGRVPLPPALTSRERGLRAEQNWQHLREVGDHDAAAEQRISMLTHFARAALLEAGVYPASRPELAKQLVKIGCSDLASDLDGALKDRERLASMT